MPWRPNVFQQAFAFERDVVTTYSFATIFIPTIAIYYVMAVLVQLPRTRLYRAALLPIVYWMSLRASSSLDFSGNDPDYGPLNQGLALGTFMVALRCTAWVCAQRPYTRFPICGPANATINTRSGNTATDAVSISSAMWDACDLVLNFRLIGWNELDKKFIPVPYFQVASRRMFALITLCQLLFSVVALDILCRMIYSFGPDTFGTPKGGTIFDSSLPPLERYMKASIITLLSVTAAYITVRAIYQSLSLLFTILLQQYPSQWPPLFDSPWLSTSLTDFWGRRWHQLLRESLVGVASPLVGSLFGSIGTVIGAFALSGVLHDTGGRGVGRGGDTIPVMRFFLTHGVGVAIEFVWKRATGRRIGGIIGWLWTASWFFLTGPAFMDIAAGNGMVASEFWLDAYRPTTWTLNWIAWKTDPL